MRRITLLMHACAHAADNSNWAAGIWGKAFFFIVEVNLTNMTSTLKGITLKGSAELVADFFCKRCCFVNFNLTCIWFSAFLHAGLKCYKACVSPERGLTNLILIIKTACSWYIVRCIANPSRIHVGKPYEAVESAVAANKDLITRNSADMLAAGPDHSKECTLVSDCSFSVCKVFIYFLISMYVRATGW